MGHTLSGTIAALQAAVVRVVAVKVPGTPGSLFDGLDSHGQATARATATGGVVENAGSNSQIATAILAGLTNLPVTVSPAPSCDAGLSTSFSPSGSQTVTSGTDDVYPETISVDPADPGGHALHCSVDFLLNGLSGDSAFTQSVAITVNGADLAVVKTGPAQTTEGQNVTYDPAVIENGPANAPEAAGPRS